MPKQLLIDYLTPQQTNLRLAENQTNLAPNTLRVIGKVQEAEQKNGNGRVYPRETLERVIEEYIRGPVAGRTSLGELDHPDSMIISLSNASHVITRIWWEGNDVMAEAELLNTPAGKIAQAIVQAKIPLGISSRAMGSVQQIGETVMVQDDLDMLCWDLVSVPSTPEAYMRLAEGKIQQVQPSINPYARVNSLITEIICNATGVCALC